MKKFDITGKQKSKTSQDGSVNRLTISKGLIFCRSHEIDLESLLATNDTFKYLEQFKQFADILLQKDEWRKTFSVYDNTISSLYEACKPEILSNRRPLVFVFQYLRGVINSIIERTNIDSIDLKISELLDRSVVADDNAVSQPEYTAEYKILPTGKILDLSKIDYDKLKTEFKLAPYKNIQIADLTSSTISISSINGDATKSISTRLV